MRWNTQTIIKYLKQDSLAKYIEALGKAALGVAAIVAASQTGTVLNEVGKVKKNLEKLENISERIDKTSSQIEKSNERLEFANQDIKGLLHKIDSKLKISEASDVEQSPAFKKDDSPENLNFLLKEKFSKSNPFGIYLGDKAREEIVRAYKGGVLGKNQLAVGIAQNLSSSFLDHPSGSKIRTSD